MARRISTVFVIAFALAATVGHAATTTVDSRPILPAVVQAIEDEIYDMHHENRYFLIDGNSGGDKLPATLHVYVSRTLNDGVGVALYKDMPYGEVYRYFTVDEAGNVSLSGGPSSFPPIGGSMLTVYMPAANVSAFVQAAYGTTFSIDPQVSASRLADAERRQIKRTGYSVRLKKGVGPSAGKKHRRGG